MRFYSPVFGGLVALALMSGVAHAGCENYLKLNADGTAIGVHRIESLGGANVRLYDVSDAVRERRLPSDKRINVFNISSLFARNQGFLGFGFPNVFYAFPPEVNKTPQWTKFSAKSFFRAPSTVVDTRGFAQSGVLVVPKNLTPEQSERLYASARAHEGSRHWTCAKAVCHFLADAGVTIGGESPKNYVMPGTLLRDVLAYGLEMDGEKLEYDVIRVNPQFLEQIGFKIDQAVGMTFCRHGERACDERTIARDAVARNTLLVFAKRAGQRVMSLFLGEPTSPKDKRVLESVAVRMPAPPPGDTIPYAIKVSEPGSLGTLLRLIWGPHTLFEVPLPPAMVDRALPETLRSFPLPNPSFVTRLKKRVLFAPTVVKFLRYQLARSHREFENLSIANLYDMVRTDSPGLRNKYNLVILDDRVVVMKISIKMKIVDWILSKHLILSGYKGVRFAGEFWKAENGDIHLNRNSGTYQPTDEQLARAVALLAEIFPGVRIIPSDEL